MTDIIDLFKIDYWFFSKRVPCHETLPLNIEDVCGRFSHPDLITQEEAFIHKRGVYDLKAALTGA